MFSWDNLLEAIQSLSAGHDPVTYAIPFFILFICLEIWIDVKEKRQLYHTGEAVASITMGLVSVGINIFVKAFYFLVFMLLYNNYALFPEALSFTWVGWVLIVFADDFSFYWHHRLSHEVRILWAAHSNHHSSQDYNLAVALRQSWTEGFYKFVFWLWLPIIGFHPVMIFMMISISLIYQFFLHTETVNKLGFLEWFMNTPSHHRVHHGTNFQYLDKNHAGIFIIWDRLFGSFEPENEKVIYGLTKNIETQNPVKIASAEYESLWQDMKKTNNWGDKIKYLLNAPGWSHDGSTKTVKQILKEQKVAG